jgi:hypothetical protein
MKAPSVIIERKNPLLYTKSGELSIGPITLVFCCLVGMLAFMLEGFGIMKHISVAAWTWFGSFTTLCFIAGAAIDRARLISKGKVDEAAVDSAQPVPTPDAPVTDAMADIREHGASTHDISIDDV